MKFIRDDDLKRAFLTMMNKLVFGNDLVLKPLLISITTSNSKKNIHSMEDIEKDMQGQIESAAKAVASKKGLSLVVEKSAVVYGGVDITKDFSDAMTQQAAKASSAKK